MLDFQEIARIGVANSLAICQELFPLGRQHGREYVTGDIYGNAGDSLSINLDSGVGKDFASLEKGYGDLISLVAAVRNISQYDAAQWIADRYGHIPVAAKIETPEFVPIWPPESSPDFNHSRYGKPDKTYTYRNHDGLVINYVCRFEPIGEAKSFRPLSYGTHKGKTGWHWRQLPAPRPLYGLDKLPESGALIIVEGEKAADALKAKLPKANVVTWSGGVEGIAQADWSPLMSKKYDVLLWADNDAPGKKAMQNIATILKDHVASMGMVDVSSLPEKSDAADFEGDGIEFDEFLRQNRRAINFNTETKKSPDKIKLDFDAMNIPGLIGDTVRGIVKYAMLPQPMLALLNVLAFAGSVFGRRYASPLNTRTNVYMISIAETGAGKDHSRKIIEKIAEDSGLSQYIGGHSIRSDTGMVRGLSANGCQLLMLDEFGKLLQALTDKQAGLHHKAVIRVLMDLYSRSNAIYNHGDYADPSKNKTIVINNPNLCIYGTSTEGEYIKGLHRDAVLSGELNRVIAIKVDPVSPRRIRAINPVDDSLIEKWKEFSPKNGNLGMIVNNDTILPVAKQVAWGKCDDIQWEIREEQDKIGAKDQQTKALWNRRHENIIKIAMIFAIARDKENPEFQKSDFDIAKNIVDMSINYMASLVNNNMADNSYEGYYLKVLNYMEKHNPISRSQLGQRFRSLKTKELEDILTALENNDEIRKIVSQTRADGSTSGRKSAQYEVNYR